MEKKRLYIKALDLNFQKKSVDYMGKLMLYTISGFFLIDSGLGPEWIGPSSFSPLRGHLVGVQHGYYGCHYTTYNQVSKKVSFMVPI